jgi:hypothetical protein
MNEGSGVGVEMIELTKDRLVEARFFLGHLRDERAKNKRVNKPPPDHFRYYLNALLAAARSVVDVLGKEGLRKAGGGRQYRAWRVSWNAQYSEAKKALDELTRKMRNTLLHQGGVKMASRTEEVPIRETYDPSYQVYRRPPWLQHTAFTVRDVQYVQLEGAERDVIEVCERYVDVLTRMVDDFEKKHSGRR